MPRVNANGIDITYEETGSGEPLVLVHGTQADRHQFDVFRPLLGEGIRAIAYDQRDSPDSPVVSTDAYGMRDHADDCAAFIAALGVERAHVMGTSYGGSVAMMTAIHHSERVQSLILGATTPAWAMAEPIRNEGASAQGPEAIARFMLEILLSPHAIDTDPALVAETKAALCPRSEEALARRMGALFSFDCIADLGRITAPTLVLHGDDDRIITPKTAAFTAEHIPGSKLHLLEGSRHGITLEQRDRTAAVVRDFVLAHA